MRNDAGDATRIIVTGTCSGTHTATCRWAVSATIRQVVHGYRFTCCSATYWQVVTGSFRPALPRRTGMSARRRARRVPRDPSEQVVTGDRFDAFLGDHLARLHRVRLDAFLSDLSAQVVTGNRSRRVPRPPIRQVRTSIRFDPFLGHLLAGRDGYPLDPFLGDERQV